MIKPASLRAAFAATLPDLARDPERLLMWASDGGIHATQGDNRSFEYRYTMNVVALNFAANPSLIMVVLVDWLNLNQPDLLFPDGKPAFAFEVDILDNGAFDVDIRLTLSESVAVTRRADGGFDMQHLAEVPFADDLGLGGVDPIPNLNQAWLDTGDKIAPNVPPLGFDVQ